MGNKLYDETSISNIADAIRSKNGTNETYTIEQMATAISNIPIDGIPELLFTQSSNKANLVTHTYTFTESGTFQYYVFSVINSDPSEIIIKLNGTIVTPNSGMMTSTTYMLYGEVTVSANDVITAENTTTNNNYPIETFIFKKADISRFSIVGFVPNNGQTFSITNQNVPMLHVYQTSYYNGRNNQNYQVVSYLPQPIPTPNAEIYWYGFTYVITL